MSKETIVAAAVFHGATISLPSPARHHTILNHMAITMKIDAVAVPCENQGFLTSQGRYVGRVEAYYLAYAAGQIKNKTGNPDEPVLFSEDVW